MASLVDGLLFGRSLFRGFLGGGGGGGALLFGRQVWVVGEGAGAFFVGRSRHDRYFGLFIVTTSARWPTTDDGPRTTDDGVYTAVQFGLLSERSVGNGLFTDVYEDARANHTRYIPNIPYDRRAKGIYSGHTI